MSNNPSWFYTIHPSAHSHHHDCSLGIASCDSHKTDNVCKLITFGYIVIIVLHTKNVSKFCHFYRSCRISHSYMVNRFILQKCIENL